MVMGAVDVVMGRDGNEIEEGEVMERGRCGIERGMCGNGSVCVVIKRGRRGNGMGRCGN